MIYVSSICLDEKIFFQGLKVHAPIGKDGSQLIIYRLNFLNLAKIFLSRAILFLSWKKNILDQADGQGNKLLSHFKT